MKRLSGKEDRSNDPIIEKIQKLLALSESSNENEAAVAAAMAARLMLQHGIEQSEIPSQPKDDLGWGRVHVEVLFRGDHTWQLELASSVATAMGCQSGYHVGKGKPITLYFLGRLENTKAVHAVWDDLCCRLRVLAAVESERRKRDRIRRGPNFTATYLRGLAYRVGLRFAAEVKSAAAEIGKPAQDLRLAMVEDGKAASQKFGVTINVSDSTEPGNGDAFLAGYKHGERVDLGTRKALEAA